MQVYNDDPDATARYARRYAQCRRRQVGAVLMLYGEAVGWGANRSVDPELSCLDGDCPRGLLTYEERAAYASYGDCIAKHAEIAALEMAGPLARGAVLHVTEIPCDDCGEVLRTAGCFNWRIVQKDDCLRQTLPASVTRANIATGRIYPAPSDVG